VVEKGEREEGCGGGQQEGRRRRGEEGQCFFFFVSPREEPGEDRKRLFCFRCQGAACSRRGCYFFPEAYQGREQGMKRD